MKKENKSRFAILGILSLGPMSGYDIKKTIEKSISNFWNESYGQIYPMLKSLVAEQLAVCSSETRPGKLDRNVYALTERGRKELGNWLSEPVAHQVGRIEILLKLFFGAQIPVSDSRNHVERFRELHLELRKRYEAIEKQLKIDHASDQNLPYWLMTVRLGQQHSHASLNWCDETLATLTKLENKRDAGKKKKRRSTASRVNLVKGRPTQGTR